MRAERRAILHIGHKKTGTTFIQNRFHASRAALRNAGLLYPLPEPNHSYALSGAFHREHVERTPALSSRYVADRDAALRALDAELAGADWHTLMLSAEAIAGFTPLELTRLSDWLRHYVTDVTIVFVVRDPVDWAVSVAQQRIKTRGDLDVVLSEPEPPRWSMIIERCRSVFGPEAVIVLEYEALAAVRDDFAARFARRVGLSCEVAALVEGSSDIANESLSMGAALMLGRYNARTLEPQGEGKRPARTGIEPRAFVGLPGGKFDLPQATRLKAYTQSRADVAFLAAAFGITRYDYPVGDLAPSRYSEEISPLFIEALADRLVGLQAQAMANHLLWDAERLRGRGKHAAAAAALDTAAARFPDDKSVIRAKAMYRGDIAGRPLSRPERPIGSRKQADRLRK